MWSTVVLVFLATDPAPQQIVGGTAAEVCQFPSVVTLRGSDCSGSLVAPTIVLTAGHCLDPEVAGTTTSVRLGESYGNPARTIPVERCERHPDYELTTNEDGHALVVADVGFCELSEPVTDVAPIPIMMGCEVDELEPGGELTIVGFGHTQGGNGEPTQGFGTKRHTTQTIETVDDPEGDIRMIGPETGVCFGDSGGPALAQVSDGTWRIAGVASTTHPDPPSGCGYGSVYDLVFPHMEWLESAAGVDLSPCHDADGTWSPTEDCGGFPLTPQETGHVWAEGCGPHALSDLGQMCGPAFGDDDSGGTGSTGGQGSTGDPKPGTGDTSDGSTGGAGPVTDASTSDDSSGGTGGGTPDTTAVSGEDDADAAAGDGGCSCKCPSTPPPPSLLLGFALLALARRRSHEHR